MHKELIFKYAKENFGSEPEYLWEKYPNYSVLRNKENGKWYAAIMDVPKEKLGLVGDGNVEILNVKCDPIMIGTLLKKRGFLPAYHMNKDYWISIVISDDTILDNEIIDLLCFSYNIVKKHKKKPNLRG